MIRKGRNEERDFSMSLDKVREVFLVFFWFLVIEGGGEMEKRGKSGKRNGKEGREI